MALHDNIVLIDPKLYITESVETIVAGNLGFLKMPRITACHPAAMHYGGSNVQESNEKKNNSRCRVHPKNGIWLPDQITLIVIFCIVIDLQLQKWRHKWISGG